MSASFQDTVEWLVLDPVMRREVIGVSHRPTAYIFRTAYVVVLAGLLYIIWTFVEAGRFRSYSEFAAAGNRLFQWFAFVQFTLAMLAGFVLGADLLPRETRSRTLELLLVSPVSSRAIVWGKWKACAGYLMLVIFSSAPVLAVTVYMGGVQWIDFIGVYSVTITWGAMAAALSLYYSTRFETAYATVAMSAFLVIMYMFFTLCCGVPFGGGGLQPYDAGAWVNPIYSIYASIVSFNEIGQLGFIGSSSLALIFLCIFLTMTVTRVGSPWRREAAAMSPETAFAAPDPGGGGGSMRYGRFKWMLMGDRWLERNPMQWKEMQWRSQSGVGMFIKVALIVIAAMSPFFCLMYMSHMREAQVSFIIWTVLAALWPAAIVSGAESFTQEKERRMWEVLMSTPLSARQIVSAKLVSRFIKSVGPFLAILALAMLGAAVVWQGGFAGLSIALAAHAIFAVFISTLATFASLIVAKTRSALAIATLVVFVVAGLLPAVTKAWGVGGTEAGLATFVELAVNPTAYHDAIQEPESGRWMIGTGEALSAEEYGASLAVFATIYGSMTLGMLVLMLARMRDLGRRYLG